MYSDGCIIQDHYDKIENNETSTLLYFKKKEEGDIAEAVINTGKVRLESCYVYLNFTKKMTCLSYYKFG